MRGMSVPSLPSWNPEKNNHSRASSLFSPCKFKSHVIFISPLPLLTTPSFTLQNKLTHLFVPTSVCQWINSFLTEKQQLVGLGKFSSSTRTISTGAPQGCVLSQLLFSLYTNDCTSKDPSVKLLKFANDTTLIGLIQDRAVRYDNIYRMDEIKSLSFHIMFYRLFCGVSKYIVSGNKFSSFEWLRSLYASHHGAWRGDGTTSQDKTRSSFLNEGLHL